jgi:hypothetical protein
MNKQEIKIAIAESRGWVKQDPVRFESDFTYHKKGQGFQLLKNLPDYTSDLNACAEFEDTMTEEQLPVYEFHLQRVTGKTNPFRANAEQRCVAYLKTIGWEGGAE